MKNIFKLLNCFWAS